MDRIINLKPDPQGDKSIQHLHVENEFVHAIVVVNENNRLQIRDDLKTAMNSLDFLEESNIYDA